MFSFPKPQFPSFFFFNGAEDRTQDLKHARHTPYHWATPKPPS